MMSFSGVGVYGHNGVAERGVYTVLNTARTMMLNQILIWTKHFDKRL